MGRDGQCGTCVKKALLRQILIVGYLKFVESKPGTELHSGKETSQVAVHECYCNTLYERFCLGIWKLPKKWQQRIT